MKQEHIGWGIGLKRTLLSFHEFIGTLGNGRFLTPWMKDRIKLGQNRTCRAMGEVTKAPANELIELEPQGWSHAYTELPAMGMPANDAQRDLLLLGMPFVAVVY